MRLIEYGPDKGKPLQLSTYVIIREYAETHGIGVREIKESDLHGLHSEKFSVEDLNLSLDDFSRKQGWIK